MTGIGRKRALMVSTTFMHSQISMYLIMTTATTLAKDLNTAWVLYVDNRDHFQKLTEISHGQIAEWYKMSKVPELVDGIVRSVYRHSVTSCESDGLSMWRTYIHSIL